MHLVTGCFSLIGRVDSFPSPFSHAEHHYRQNAEHHYTQNVEHHYTQNVEHHYRPNVVYGVFICRLRGRFICRLRGRLSTTTGRMLSTTTGRMWFMGCLYMQAERQAEHHYRQNVVHGVFGFYLQIEG